MYRVGLTEYEPPSDIVDGGPQWDAPIRDALSEARGYLLDGADVAWIYTNYRPKLQTLINQKIWRSADAARFALELDEAYQKATQTAESGA